MIKYLRHLLFCRNHMINRFVGNEWYLECLVCLHRTDGIKVEGGRYENSVGLRVVPIAFQKGN